MIATDLLSVEGIRRGLGASTVGRQLYLVDDSHGQRHIALSEEIRILE
ncbi:MAG: hypothetical protein AAB328_07505 [candidate division NC10 bacterium]